MTKRFLVLLMLASTVCATTASAQRRSNSSNPIELGIDAGVAFGLDDPNLTIVGLPVQDFRLGYFMNERMELEPRFNLNSIRGNGGSITTYKLELGVLFMPRGDRVGKGLYFRPLLGVAGASGSGGGSDNSGYAGIGAGIKIPFADRRLATRLEGNFQHGFDNGGTNALGLLAGLSFFTR